MGKIIVEIGSWVGRTALVMASEPSVDRIYCIDTFEGSTDPEDWITQKAKELGRYKVFDTFCKNIGDQLFTRISPCRSKSLDEAKIWDLPLSMVFIDGDHDQCGQDIEAWAPHLVPHGIICGHDYGIFPKVKEDVDRLLGPSVTTLGRSLWVAEMTKKAGA